MYVNHLYESKIHKGYTIKSIKLIQCFTETLREKDPSTEFFSGPYFAVSGMNTRKYRPEKTPYLDSFHALKVIAFLLASW